MNNFIIAIMGQKGGSGKTTVAFNLYSKFIKDKHSAILVDCDNDQYSSTELSLLRKANNLKPNLPVETMKSSELPYNIEKLGDQYQIIIIEFGGKITDEMQIASQIADIILMPLQASILDAMTIKNVEAVISEYASKVPCLIVPNRVKSKKQLQFLLAIKDELKYFKITDSSISDKLYYQYILNDGKTVFEMDRSDCKKEMLKLYKEILR